MKNEEDMIDVLEELRVKEGIELRNKKIEYKKIQEQYLRTYNEVLELEIQLQRISVELKNESSKYKKKRKIYDKSMNELFNGLNLGSDKKTANKIYNSTKKINESQDLMQGLKSDADKLKSDLIIKTKERELLEEQLKIIKKEIARLKEGLHRREEQLKTAKEGTIIKHNDSQDR